MKQRNAEIRNQILEDVEVFRAVRRSDVVMQIREHMRLNGIRTSDMAERLGVSDANVSRWLRGDQNLKIDTLYLLAEAAEASIAIMVSEAKRAVDDFEEDPCESTVSLTGNDQFDSSSGAGAPPADSKVVDYSQFCQLRDRSAKAKPAFHAPQSGSVQASEVLHSLAA